MPPLLPFYPSLLPPPPCLSFVIVLPGCLGTRIFTRFVLPQCFPKPARGVAGWVGGKEVGYEMHPSPLFPVTGHPSCPPGGDSVSLSGGFGVGGGYGHPGSALLWGEGGRLLGAMGTRYIPPQLGILLPGADPLGSGRRGLAPLPGRSIRAAAEARWDMEGDLPSPEGKCSRQGKGAQRVRGTARSPAPLPSLAPPGSRGLRSSSGPAAVRLGEREHNTSLLVSVP